MKEVLISIQPKWCEKIASGEKTIEVRKTKPKLGIPFKCYIYCTYGNAKENYCVGKRGKVIGEFVCDRVAGEGETIRGNACLTVDELIDYCNGKDLYFWHISDLKIYDKPKELGEFKYHCKYEYDDDFKHCYDCDYHYYSNTPSSGIEEWCTCDGLKTLTRPPQSWCYVEVQQ